MHYLVTGGAGFIGSHIATALIERGDRVTVLDNFSTGKRSNLDHLQGHIEILEGSIEDFDFLQKAFRGIDVVFHEAAIPSVPRSIEDPLGSHQANATGTLHVLLAARDQGVRRVVYASSSSVYGDQEPDASKHEKLPAQPLSPYGLVKHVGEEYCRLFYPLYGLETVSLRYFNVFGPRQDPQSLYAAVIPKFIRAALERKPATLFGDGQQSRDFTYVANVVHGNLLAATASAEKAAGKTFNLACGDSISLLSLLENIEHLVGHPVEREFLPAREGDIRFSRANISAIQEALEYRPIVSFEEGLRKTVEGYGGAKKTNQNLNMLL